MCLSSPSLSVFLNNVKTQYITSLSLSVAVKQGVVSSTKLAPGSVSVAFAQRNKTKDGAGGTFRFVVCSFHFSAAMHSNVYPGDNVHNIHE